MIIHTIEVKAEFLFELKSKQDWINKVPKILPPKKYHDVEFLWLDKDGYELIIGVDFSAAEVRNSYPVKVYRKIPVHIADKIESSFEKLAKCT